MAKTPLSRRELPQGSSDCSGSFTGSCRGESSGAVRGASEAMRSQAHSELVAQLAGVQSHADATQRSLEARMGSLEAGMGSLGARIGSLEAGMQELLRRTGPEARAVAV